MSVTTKLTQVDGIFTSSLSEATFSPISGTPTFAQGQLYLADFSDSTNTNNGHTDIPVVGFSGTSFLKKYNTSTGAWDNFSKIDDLSYYNIVLKRVGSSNTYNLYFAKDSELAYIPNFTEEARIRYRINEQLTPQTVTAKKKIKFPTAGTTGICPLVPYAYWDSNAIAFITVEVVNGKLQLYDTIAINNDTATETYGNDILQFPKYSYFIELANTQVQDLETRVSILENEVADLKVMVSEHSKVLKDLPALVSAVSSNVSKLYVAR